MPPTHPSQADVAAAYRTLIAHETEPKEQDFYRTRLQRLEQATESVCEFDCRSRVAAAGVGVYCPQCSATCAETDLATQLAIQQIEGEAAWWRSIDFDRNASRTFESMTGDSQQAVRTGVEQVLAHLTAAGRLLAADDLVLAGAEKAALKRLLAAQTGIVSRDVYDAIECLRALFPAIEPAEEETKAEGFCSFCGWSRDACARGKGDCTPAEPAEEETKAEAADAMQRRFIAEIRSMNPDAVMSKRLDDLEAELNASSPVVPAPTETEAGHA